MARVPYLRKADLPGEYTEMFEVDEDDSGDNVLRAHRAMANNPRLLQAWDEWARTLYDEVDDARIRELVILAVTREIGSRYIWHQHVQYALEEGVTRGEIVAVADRAYDGFSPQEGAVLEYVTGVVTTGIDDETHDNLVRFVSNATLVAILFLASEYLQGGILLDTLGVELEETIVGWELEGLE